MDDHSTDDTAKIASAHGARVIAAPPLPRGWIGKPWACAVGAREAKGELLLFTDADTVHAPDSLTQAIALMYRNQAALVSLLPFHRPHAWWEKQQGTFHLLLLIATRAGASDGPISERAYANGQYLLFRRDVYERLGGHEAVRDRVAEDLAFCRTTRERGERTALLMAPGLLEARMYPEGLSAFLRGWRRNFREGIASAGIAGFVEMIAVVSWLLGWPIATVRAIATGAWWEAWLFGLLVVATIIEVARRQKITGPMPAWSALLYPLPVIAFIWISGCAAWDQLRGAPVRWRGRTVAYDEARTSIV